jgi:hypothetical protein
MAQLDRPTVAVEFEGVRLGDKRLDRRLHLILPKLAAAPDHSFPEQMGSEADQEALYRFLGNPKVTLEGMLHGHCGRTLDRIGDRPLVRIVHDTTEFAFEGERDGLGGLKGGLQGFLGHFSLVVSADECRLPLGVLAVHPFIKKHAQQGASRTEKQIQIRATPREEKKSHRWEKVALEAAAHLREETAAIHVMDQEADDYSVFSALMSHSQRFVIRVETDRRTSESVETDVFLARGEATLFRRVSVSSRSKRQATKQHPARDERLVEFHVRSGSITLRRPESSADAILPELSLQAVHVFEANPPPGEDPVEWMLFTSESVDSLQEIEAVVDHYRARWVIEEYFKALKTGCAFEKRQLTTLDSLLRALALFVPMAWTLLALRNLGRDQPDRDAREVFTEQQLQLLRLLLTKRRKDLPKVPTVRDAMLGVAALGGHIKNNGDPGWLVLGRGLRRFCDAEEILTLLTKRSDQS